VTGSLRAVVGAVAGAVDGLAATPDGTGVVRELRDVRFGVETEVYRSALRPATPGIAQAHRCLFVRGALAYNATVASPSCSMRQANRPALAGERDGHWNF
jgi:hypothetical protein